VGGGGGVRLRLSSEIRYLLLTQDYYHALCTVSTKKLTKLYAIASKAQDREIYFKSGVGGGGGGGGGVCGPGAPVA